MTPKIRTFEDKPATRERVPCMVGLVGPSNSGKTYSALRIATGMQRVAGGDIFFIDTENRRSLFYAKDFRFRHVDLHAPFGPLDYLAAVEHCVKKGAGVIIIDSASHEHEGPGGVLEMHEMEVERMCKGPNSRWTPDKANLPAWNVPKRQRRRLINTLLQQPSNFIFCFRAKEKLKIKPGKEPVQLGWMAIAGEEFIFEMSANVLLEPGAEGVPTWETSEIGERQWIKRPNWALPLMPNNRQLDEGIGEALARYTAGEVVRSVSELLASYESCVTSAALGPLEVERRALWGKTSADEKKSLKAAAEGAQARVNALLAQAEPNGNASDDPTDDDLAEIARREKAEAEAQAPN